jgi:cell cycle sensor histidine kinase DivJ
VLTVLAGALAVNLVRDGLDPALLIALGAGLAPGLVVVVAGPVAGRWPLAVLSVWALAGAAATLATGGLGGPMAAWCLAPIAVAGTLEQRKIAGLAAGLSFLAGVAAAVAPIFGLVGERPPEPIGFILGLTSVAALATAISAGLITARRAARKAPVRNDAIAVLQSQPDQTLVIDAFGAVKAVFGRLNTTLRPGDAFVSLARGEDRPALREAFEAVVGNTMRVVEFTPVGDLDRRFTLFLGPLGEDLILGVVRDTTHERDRRETLEAARQAAEDLAAGKSRFLAGMSHELRTPLNAIMGFSDMMRARMFGELPGKYAEYADLIHESGAHLLDLINDVLDMSKIEAQRFELHLEVMDVRDPIHAALRLLRLQAEEACVTLRAELPSQPLEVDADARALKQIVINLVSNALKFTPAEGTVIVGVGTRGAELYLTVADTGVGVSPEDLKRIGRPYEQAGDAKGRAKGTGLGLALVRAFAELHGGTMVIESRVGHGTAVTVTLPIVVQAEAQQSPPAKNVVAFNPQR